MAVNHRRDIGPRAINLAVNEALEVHAARIVGREIAVEVEFVNVVGLHERGRHVARDQETIGALVVPDADVAERIDDAFVEQNMIGVDQVLQQLRIDRRFAFHHRSTLSRQSPSACCIGRSEKLNSTLSSSAS